MEIEFIENDSLGDFKNALKKVSQTAKSIMILSCDANSYDSEELNCVVKSSLIPIIGGVFPQIIFKNKNYSIGTIIIGISDKLETYVVEGISKKSRQELNTIVEEKIGELELTIKTMFVFVDGLSKNINSLLLALFENFGLSINYIGGGAGSLSFEQKPCLFTNRGFLEDCALMATSSLESSVGVKHGWTPISDPMKVTLSEANIVKEIDYEPAFGVYKQIVEKASGQKFGDDNFFDIAKGFPLGINKLSGEMVVRDPIRIDDEKNLVCVGDVAINSFISILEGSNDSLINAAVEADAEANIGDINNFTLFIDCISRALFMEDEYSKELDVVNSEGKNLIGALTLGEIANNKKYYLEFYNKTAVVSKIEIRSYK